MCASCEYWSAPKRNPGAILPPVPRKTAVAEAPKDETIGLRLKRLRKERGLTQVQLAQAASSAHALVSRYEADQVLPHTDAAARIADAPGVSTD
jgi:DNA-binding XRE family transcriptional regulator